MKAIKNCFWKYLGKHKFEIVPGSIVHHSVPRCGNYKRICTRCGLYQEISVTVGLHFLDKETGGK